MINLRISSLRDFSRMLGKAFKPNLLLKQGGRELIVPHLKRHDFPVSAEVGEGWEAVSVKANIPTFRIRLFICLRRC